MSIFARLRTQLAEAIRKLRGKQPATPPPQKRRLTGTELGDGRRGEVELSIDAELTRRGQEAPKND
jgi:hypothetical protein